MILVALVVGLILIAAAIRNTQSQLFSALGEDLPAFTIWAAALVAVGALGFIPGLRTPSRYLLALVITVIILANYKAILAGFTSVSTPGQASAAGPASAQSSATPPAQASAGAASANPLTPVSPASYGLPTTLGAAIGDLSAGFGGNGSAASQ